MDKDKTAVIIGASRGIGLATANKLAAKCSKLILTEIEEQMDLLLKETKQLKDKYGIDISCYSLDIRNLENIESVFCEIDEKHIVIDYLVCNAGINILCKAIEVTHKIWDDINNINLRGTFFVMQQAARNMILYNGGSIVTLGSQHGMQVNYNRTPYCASKAGLIHLSRALALEWAAYDIRVNSVSPTYVLNEENESLLMSPKGKKQYQQSIPLYLLCRNSSCRSVLSDEGCSWRLLGNAPFKASAWGGDWREYILSMILLQPKKNGYRNLFI